MKRLFGYQSYWYVGAIADPGAPRMGGGRAGDSPSEFWPYSRGRFARSRGHRPHRSEPRRRRSHVDYVNAKAMPLPRAPSGSAAQAQDDLINTLASQSNAGRERWLRCQALPALGQWTLVRLGVPHPATDDSERGHACKNSGPPIIPSALLAPI